MLKKFGPGLLVAAAFVGPGTLAMCTMAGARFGYDLIWALALSIVATIILQGMAARIGLVTQRGLMDVVKRELGTPWVRRAVIGIVLGAILIGNAAYQAGNIGGALLGLGQLVPFGAFKPFLPLLMGGIIFVLLWYGNYKILERVFMGLVALMGLGFIICALMTRPSLTALLKGMFVPEVPQGSLFTIIALVGTTVVPYNLFLHTALVREKWKSVENLKAVKWDTILSIGIGGVVSLAILVTAAAVPLDELTDVLDMAKGLEPLFGKFAVYSMSIGLLAAGFTSAITAPLAAAFVASSCFGWEGDMRDKRFKMVWALVLLCGIFFLSFDIRPIEIIQFAQAANGLLLPIMALLLLWAVNRKAVMGIHMNSRLQNILGLAIVLLSLVLGVRSVLGALGLY